MTQAPPPKPKTVPLATKAAVDAERAVLGSMLLDKSAARKVLDSLQPPDFYRDDHRAIYEAAAAVFKRDATVDHTTVLEELKQRGALPKIGEGLDVGASYLITCVNAVSTVDHAVHYALLVKDASLDRQIDKQLLVIQAEKTNEKLKKIRDLVDAKETLHAEPLFDFRRDLAAALDELTSKRPTIINTGFRDLDAILGGLEVGDLTTIGARTSGGKTAIMTKMALSMAQSGVSTLYVTTEMTQTQMVGRILPIAARVPAYKFRKRSFTPADIRKLSDACGDRLSMLPLAVYGKSQPALADLRTAVARFKPRVVFIDYLQRCRFPAGDIRAYQILDFMVELKSLAQEQRMNVFLGCQLDRKLDKAPTGHPSNSDLKDSGGIEAESDQIVLLWRPTPKEIERVGGWTPRPGHVPIQAIVSKNRHGSAGVITQFELDGDYVDFVEKESPPPQDDMWDGRKDLN